jgi:acyl-homoserine lactone acylase PvdQ
VLVTVAALGSAAAAVSPPERVYTNQAWNVLPPGQAGGVAFTKNSTDQEKLYDALTAMQGNVTDRELGRYFKRATLGVGAEKPVTTERPRKGLVIERDRWGVPHVTGARDVDVVFGAGWATAQDRQLIIELLRGPGRLAALDAPGISPFAAALSGRTFVPSAQTESYLASQFDLLERRGAKGRRVVRLIDAYIAGINAWYRKAGLPLRRWTRQDVVAVGSLIGAIFGSGGGDETRRTNFLALLQRRLGAEGGRSVWEDLRLRDDPEARVAVEGSFPYGTETQTELGNVVIDPDSFVPAGTATLGLAGDAVTPQPSISNALLVGARRSATGKPLFVAGPQVGYYYPAILLELDLQGGGFDARGAAFPGISFAVLLGRGPDYAWSATSAGSDLIDEYAETLCEGSDVKYLYKGECRSMTTFDAGVLRGAPGTAEQRVVFRQTVHGPVVGYATVQGERVAIAQKRSTRGRELLSSAFFVDLSTAVPRSAKEFLRVASQMELTFNWVYADDRDIAQFTSGRIPRRPSSVDPGLLTKGTGDFEWAGFMPPAAHAQVINPKSGTLLNWNNKPARGFAASDSEWAWGPVQRVDLLWREVQRRKTHTLGSVVAAMNVAATQDLRAVRVWPTVRAVLSRDFSPGGRAAAAVALVDQWVAAGGSRLDRDLDGRIDAPGAAILDAAWPLLADSVLGDVIGSLTADLAALVPRDDTPGPSGSSYGDGWYSYLDKDLRSLLGNPVRRPFHNRYCGRGDPVVCAGSLWAAIDRAVTELEQSQGSDPTAWRADAAKERIAYAPGILRRTMRWTNRPTFQQAISFTSHRRP